MTIYKKSIKKTSYFLDDGSEFSSEIDAINEIRRRSLVELYNRYYKLRSYPDTAFANLVQNHFVEIQKIMNTKSNVVETTS